MVKKLYDGTISFRVPMTDSLDYFVTWKSVPQLSVARIPREGFQNFRQALF